MEDDEIEYSDSEPLMDEGWRNSLAPNDGYYPQNRHRATIFFILFESLDFNIFILCKIA